jgi:hypothetical protein
LQHVTGQVLNINLQGQNVLLWELKPVFMAAIIMATVIWDLMSGMQMLN